MDIKIKNYSFLRLELLAIEKKNELLKYMIYDDFNQEINLW